MKPLPTTFAALILAGSALGDVTVNFSNDMLGPNARVVWGRWWPWGSEPVVNNFPPGQSFVAQLGISEGGAFTAVGGPASFRNVPVTDPLAGTWIGQIRTIPGLPADATVDLAVRVWDAYFSSYDAAIASGGNAGQSATFSYRNALSEPPLESDTYMVNFSGFDIPTLPEPGTYALAVLGLGGLLLRSRRKH